MKTWVGSVRKDPKSHPSPDVRVQVSHVTTDLLPLSPHHPVYRDKGTRGGTVPVCYGGTVTVNSQTSIELDPYTRFINHRLDVEQVLCYRRPRCTVGLDRPSTPVSVTTGDGRRTGEVHRPGRTRGGTDATSGSCRSWVPFCVKTPPVRTPVVLVSLPSYRPRSPDPRLPASRWTTPPADYPTRSL